MDLPPQQQKPETTIVASLPTNPTDEQLNDFDSEIALLLRNTSASQTPRIQTSSPSENFEKNKKELKALFEVMEKQIPSVESSVDLFSERLHAVEELGERFTEQQKKAAAEQEK